MNISRLQNFVEHVNTNGGVFVPQRWEFTINRPVNRSWFSKYGINNFDRHVALSCTNATLPGRSISTNAVVAPGPEQKYPYQDVFEDLSVTFLCTTGNRNKIGGGVKGIPERRFIDAWMASVCDPPTMIMGYCEDYKSTIKLKSYDKVNTVLGEYEFERVYPIDVGPVEFTHDTEEVATFEVTFNYDRWNYIY